MKSIIKLSLAGFANFLLAVVMVAAQAAEPLPSWNDRAVRSAIVKFVDTVTTQGSPDFVPESERIAVFDDDGTLWAERPMYFQLIFAIDRVKALATKHPEWKRKEPFAALLKGDVKTALTDGEHAALEIVMATHAGITTAERKNRAGVDRHSAPSDDPSALYRDDLSADA